MSYMSEANAIAATLRGEIRPSPRSRRSPTDKQLKVLQYMRDFHREQDQLPPVAYIARHFGWRSPQSALEHVDALIAKGELERNVCGKLRFARPKSNGGAA